MKESFHERVTLLGDAPSFGSQHPVFDFGELEFELPVPRVLFGVGPGVVEVRFRIVELGSYLSGKQKSSADTDGADGIELVRVKKGSGFQGFRRVNAAKPVGFDAVDDGRFFSSERG